MIAVGLATVLIAVLSAAWWWTFYGPSARPQHAGAGLGTVTVQHLVNRLADETSDHGRHLPLEPVAGWPSDLSTALADAPTRIQPRTAAPALPSRPCRPTDDVLRRVLDGLQRL